MEGRFDIFLDGKSVGRVVVERQGLYYRFDCRCRLKDGELYRLTVEQDGVMQNLGVLLPSGDAYWLTTKQAVKKFGRGTPLFRIQPKTKGRGGFIPVYPEEPFLYLDRLKNAYLELRDGITGVVIPEPDPRGNGRNP